MSRSTPARVAAARHDSVRPAAVGGGRTPYASRCGRRRARVLAAVLGAVLLAGAAAEAVATTVVERGVEAALRPRLGRTDADLAGSGLLALARGRAGRVTVTGDDATLGRVTGASVRLRLDGVPLHGGGSRVVDAVRGRIAVPTGAIRTWLTTGDRPLPVSEVTTDPAAGVLRLGLGPGGVLGVSVRPELRDGHVEFTLDSATLMGAPAPDRLTLGIRDRLAAVPEPRGAAPTLRPTSVRVTAGGVEAGVDARHASLSPAP